MYKLTQPDGFDFYSGTINYRDAIGGTVEVADYDSKEVGVCGRGLHASFNPNDCFVGANIPCAAFKVQGIGLIARNNHKNRYRKLKVIEEVDDLDTLFGWRYYEAVCPVNPFGIQPPDINDNHIDLLKKWNSIWNSVRGSAVGLSVWGPVFDVFWESAGDFVGLSVGDYVRPAVGHPVWDSVGNFARDFSRGYDRDFARGFGQYFFWESIWESTWDAVSAYLSSLFPNIRQWKRIQHHQRCGVLPVTLSTGINPFQPAIDLWNQGFVPSFDGEQWRLHYGPKGEFEIIDI